MAVKVKTALNKPLPGYSPAEQINEQIGFDCLDLNDESSSSLLSSQEQQVDDEQSVAPFPLNKRQPRVSIGSWNVPAYSLLLGIMIGCYIECSAITGRGLISAGGGGNGQEPSVRVVAFLAAWNGWTSFCLSIFVNIARGVVADERPNATDEKHSIGLPVERRFCMGTVIGVLGLSVLMDRFFGLGGGIFHNCDMWLNVGAFCLCFQYCFDGEAKLAKLLIALFEAKRPLLSDTAAHYSDGSDCIFLADSRSSCLDLEQGSAVALL
jgi:hypothetical protein